MQLTSLLEGQEQGMIYSGFLPWRELFSVFSILIHAETVRNHWPFLEKHFMDFRKIS